SPSRLFKGTPFPSRKESTNSSTALCFSGGRPRSLFSTCSAIVISRFYAGLIKSTAPIIPNWPLHLPPAKRTLSTSPQPLRRPNHGNRFNHRTHHRSRRLAPGMARNRRRHLPQPRRPGADAQGLAQSHSDRPRKQEVSASQSRLHLLRF